MFHDSNCQVWFPIFKGKYQNFRNIVENKIVKTNTNNDCYDFKSVFHIQESFRTETLGENINDLHMKGGGGGRGEMGSDSLISRSFYSRFPIIFLVVPPVCAISISKYNAMLWYLPRCFAVPRNLVNSA